MKGSDLWRFVGRRDVFAQQTEKGAYFPVRRPLTEEDLQEHLDGGWSLGAYTTFAIDGKFFVNQVVFDLDSGEENLDTLCDCVERLINPMGEHEYPMLLLERSGGKGYHVWLFLDEMVEAYRVRAWLAEGFWPNWNDATGSTDLEVFPKQDTLREDGGFGNLVKLPFGVHAKTGNRSEIVLGRGWVSETSSAQGVSTKVIPLVSNRRPEVVKAITASTPTGILLNEGPVSRFLRGEVGKGERNHAFHAFFTWTAWNLHLPSDLAWDWCSRLNEELTDPETNTDEMAATMESAYARPPADAAKARPTRGRPTDSGEYRKGDLADRLAALRTAKGVT